jgi:hypothetical protein
MIHEVKARATGPLGRGKPLPWEPAPMDGRFPPPEPTRRWTETVPVQANTLPWKRLTVTTPMLLRMRSRPSPSPASGCEFLQLYTSVSGTEPVGGGEPAIGNYALLGMPGEWWYMAFSNVGTVIDFELIDVRNPMSADAITHYPKAFSSVIVGDTSVAGADTVILWANQNVERRTIILWNNPNVGTPTVRIVFGAAATATKGIPITPLAATNSDRLVLDYSQVPLQSIHAFGASNFVGAAIFT